MAGVCMQAGSHGYESASPRRRGRPNHRARSRTPGVEHISEWETDEPTPRRYMSAENRGVEGHDVTVWWDATPRSRDSAARRTTSDLSGRRGRHSSRHVRMLNEREPTASRLAKITFTNDFNAATKVTE